MASREPETRALVCPHCERAATAKTCGTAVWDGYTGDDWVTFPTQWEMIQCDHCSHVVVEWREDYGEGFEADEPMVVYPAPRRLNTNIPRKLRAEWDEARQCFDSKAYTATVVMVRRTLEGTCKDQGADERTLALSIKKLKDLGKISETLADWADLLRVVGNEGAHFTGNRVPRQDAEDALAFAEALLDHIYVLTTRFAEFKERRDQTAKKKVVKRKKAGS